MKRRKLHVVWLWGLLFLMTACGDDDYYYPSVKLEFVTVEAGEDGRIQTLIPDKGEVLTVSEDRTGSTISPNTSRRVMSNYEVLSADGQYRIVRYVDKPTGERRTASYYVEDISKDKKIPFGSAKRVLGSGWVVTAKYTSKSDSPVSWVTKTVDGKKVEMLSVEGTLKENPYLVAEISATEELEESSVPITLYYGTEDASSQGSSAEAQTAE